jgi:SAM-dependent methyltransferase
MNIGTTAFDYDNKQHSYSSYRQTDPRIAQYITNALGNARTILNVGAGSGSYEPQDRYVISLEPSAKMRAQRTAAGRSPAVIGFADNLPFDDASFDASMAIATVHHWPDVAKGLSEMRRVTRNQVIVFAWDPDSLDDMWNVHYFPELVAAERRRYPTVSSITEALGGNCEIQKIPVPIDCIDGFQDAFYARPEAFLNKEVRQAQSAWGFISDELEASYVKTLADDLASGNWDKQYGHFRTQPEFIGGIRLIVASPL